MGQINKGTIASIDGNTARILPSDAGAKPTAKIMIPWHLRGNTGNLKKGMTVVYAEFDDATGLVLGRADGEWGAYLPHLTTEIITGTMTDAGSMATSMLAPVEKQTDYTEEG